jgi:alkylation response protein AidB-like acyl-CoA dehydrogenase
MKAAMVETIPYAKQRQQFGRAIASFGLIQQKIADMAISTYVLESLIYRTAGLIEAQLATLAPDTANYDQHVIKGIEEFAVECSIAKVFGSEMLDFVVDEMVQIFGGYGFIEESPAPRAYRDARINRIFEGTNEINRLLIPDTLMRRAMRGQLPLMDAVQQVVGNLLAPLTPLTERDDNPLQLEQQVIERCKQAALLCAGISVQTFHQELAEQQEILGFIADMAIELYAAESALLRTLKYLNSGAHPASPLRLDITRSWCRELPEKIERLGIKVLAASVEGDALATPLAALKKLTRVTPLNGVTLKRSVAAATIEAERYPL